MNKNKAAGGLTEKTVSVDQRGRVKLPEPRFKRYTAIAHDDGSYILRPSVDIDPATLSKMASAIESVERGEKGHLVSAKELAEVRRLLDQT